MPPTPSLVPRTNMTPSAVYRVFHTTELLETILLDREIHMLDLFTFQRVNHKFQDVIQGSSKLRVKMFLDYSTEYGGIEDAKTIEWWERKGLIPGLFNPLSGIRHDTRLRNGKFTGEILRAPSRLETRATMAVFRHFNIRIEINGLTFPNGQLFLNEEPRGAIQKKLEPRLGGSWKNLHIAKVPMKLVFDSPKYRFVIDEFSTMADFVDHLLQTYEVGRRLERGLVLRSLLLHAEIRFV